MRTADYYRANLGLESHIEGGSFLETYRAGVKFGTGEGERSASTGIYFMLEHGDFSAFHKIDADEMWHFYDGNTLTIYDINPQGELTAHKLGLDLAKGERPQLVIQAGHWFASRCEVEGGFSFVGCTVSPGFEYSHFELATTELSKEYPRHRELISDLVRRGP